MMQDFDTLLYLCQKLETDLLTNLVNMSIILILIMICSDENAS